MLDQIFITTCSQSCRKVVTLQLWSKISCNFARSHFPTRSAFLRLYGNFFVFQSLATFLVIRSQLFKDWTLGWHKPTSEQLRPTVIRFLARNHIIVFLNHLCLRCWHSQWLYHPFSYQVPCHVAMSQNWIGRTCT